MPFMAKFDSGQIVSTPAALEEFEKANEMPGNYLARHLCGDWGDLSDDDKAQNEQALLTNGRLMSAYTLCTDVKIWIITEWDRSSTTFLLPGDY